MITTHHLHDSPKQNEGYLVDIIDEKTRMKPKKTKASSLPIRMEENDTWNRIPILPLSPGGVREVSYFTSLTPADIRNLYKGNYQ